MTNNSNNINNHSPTNHMLQTVEIDKIESYFKQNQNSKLLVLSLDDLNADIIKQLKAKQCKMIWLNENYKIVEQHKPKEMQHIQLTMDGCRQSVALKNIIRLKANGNYTNIYLKNKIKPILTSKTLKYYASKLDKNRFIRPHQSHLLNINFVETFNSKLRLIILKDTSKIIVARRRLSDIKKVLSVSNQFIS